MNDISCFSCNLNIRYDLPKEIWDRITQVYEKMPGWLGPGNEKEGKGEDGIPYWFSFNEEEKSISASVEPSGLNFTAVNINEKEWDSWISHFKTTATHILGFKVGELETGEVGDQIEWIKKP